MKAITIAALSLLIASLGLGIWTAIGGSPYNTLVLTLHKLSSIAFIVLCVLYYIRGLQGSGMTGSNLTIAVVFTVSVIALLATGGIMSAKPPTVLLRAMHITASAAAYITAGIRLLQYLIA